VPSPRGALQSPGLVGEGRPVVGEDDEEEAETKKMLERNHPKGADAKAAAEYRLAQAPQRGRPHDRWLRRGSDRQLPRRSPVSPRRFLSGLLVAGALLLLTGCTYANGGRGMIPFGAGDVVDTWKHRVQVEPQDITKPEGVVIYVHGCNGLGTLPGILYPDTRAWVQTTTQAGWRFVAPDSWARGTWNRPDGCTGDIETARVIRLLRIEEIAYAVRQLAADPTVDQKRIVLLGHSEGGLAVATAAPPKSVAGIIISGWMCHSNVPLGVGIAAPLNLPVLAMAFEHDSFVAHSTHNTIPPGRCSAFFRGRPHATELIIPGEGHTTGTRAEASQAVVKFLGGLR